MPKGLTHIEQVSTGTCRTNYKVTYNGQDYDLELWIIVGGTPCVQVSKSYVEEHSGSRRREHAPSRRFEPTLEVRVRWDTYRSGPRSRLGRFAHQDPNQIQGPTFNEVLPNGLKDIKVYLTTCNLDDLDNTAELAAEKHRWEVFCDQHRLAPRHRWPVRELEDESRVVQGKVTRHGWAVFQARNLRKSLKGLRKGDAVEFLGCVISPTVLRAIATVFGSAVLLAWGENGELFIEPQGDPGSLTQRLHFLNGAGDKYLGRNGINARVEVRRA